VTDEQLQLTVGRLLRIGVLAAAVTVATGGAWYLLVNGAAPFRENAPVTSVPEMIIVAGLVMLVATPVARVGFALVAFALEKDYTYVAIATVVLVTLLVSIASSWL
jgi:uncharacterized membrane protein